MCQKRSSTKVNVLENGRFKHIRVDDCISHLPFLLSANGFNIVACCCGHGKYPPTIVIRNPHRDHNNHYELLSGVDIPRKKRFYLKDKQGFYYIPEVIKLLKENGGNKIL
ncbi:MAG: hypothetical protein PHX21_13605 [bacterium]|nr:hypothetical protein [bacterium]